MELPAEYPGLQHYEKFTCVAYDSVVAQILWATIRLNFYFERNVILFHWYSHRPNLLRCRHQNVL